MKIRYTVSMSGKDATFPAFEKDNKGDYIFYDVDKLEAVNLINAEMAVAQKEDEYKKALAEIEKLKAEKEAKKKLDEDLAKLEEMKSRELELKEELRDLTSRIKAVESATKI